MEDYAIIRSFDSMSGSIVNPEDGIISRNLSPIVIIFELDLLEYH
jgi:hypothetical protein